MRSCRRTACATALLVGLGMSTAVGATGQPLVQLAHPTQLTLAEAVSRALAYGPGARIASLEAGQAEDALAAARSVYLPRASISSQAGYSNRLDERLRTIDGNGRERRYGLSSLGSDQGWLNVYIDQLLFDLKSWRGVERAALTAEAGRVAEAEKREAISLEVVRRYAEALRLDELAALDARRIAVAERLDAQAASLLAAGRIIASEREQAALTLETLRLHVATHVGARADARRALVDATGGDPEGELRLVPESLPVIEHAAAGSDAPDLEAELAGAPELQVLNLRKHMEDVSVAAARAERYPTVGLRAGYSNYGARRYDNFADELSVGVDLTVPLFDGFKARNAIAGALKGAEIARLRYQSALERKRARVRDLSRQLAVAVQRPALAARQVAITDERVRLTDVRLQNDRGTLGEVLTAMSAWGRDGRAAIAARFDVVVLWATLRREVGGLSAAIAATPEGDAARASTEETVTASDETHLTGARP